MRLPGTTSAYTRHKGHGDMEKIHREGKGPVDMLHP
jgi:hypothetical protein